MKWKLTVFCLIILLLDADARRIEVKPIESREVIAEAMKDAVPGDEIHLSEGTYREYVKPVSGVLLSGSVGTIIDPSEPLTGDWSPAREVGPGVWKIPAAGDVRGLLIDGKFLAVLSEPRALKEGDWHWKILLAKGPPLSGFRQIRGFDDRIGVNLFRAGAGNRILSNHLVEVFDGINLGDYTVESLTKPLEHPEHGQGTEIAWNLIQDTRDSGIEIGGGAIDVRVHHNHLLRTHGGLRFKVPRVGPVFVHHNWLQDDRGFNIWFSMDSSPATGYIYQNPFPVGKRMVRRVPVRCRRFVTTAFPNNL